MAVTAPDRRPAGGDMGLAPIEKLPAEVLEMIMIYSLEPSLPRASTAIARKVSREPIYNFFMFHAFWNDPVSYLRQKYGWNVTQDPRCHCSLPAGYIRLSPKEQRRLQISIMHCRWFSPARMNDILPVLCNHTYCSVLRNPISTTPSQLTIGVAMLRDRRGCYFAASQMCKGLGQIPTIRIFAYPERIVRGPWHKDTIDVLTHFYIDTMRWKADVDITHYSEPLRPFIDRALFIRALETAIADGQEIPFVFLLKIFTAFHAVRVGPLKLELQPLLPLRLFRLAVDHQAGRPKFLAMLAQCDPGSVPQGSILSRWMLDAFAREDWLIAGELHAISLRAWQRASYARSPVIFERWTLALIAYVDRRRHRRQLGQLESISRGTRVLKWL